MLKIRCQFIVTFFSAYGGFVPRAALGEPVLEHRWETPRVSYMPSAVFVESRNIVKICSALIYTRSTLSW